MVTTFRASEAFAGALELTGKATLVALINRCIGAVIRYMLIAVIPDIFQRPSGCAECLDTRRSK
jgi:hypothetical protein